MRILATVLVLFAMLPLAASPVTIGINSKGRPGQARECNEFIIGINDLGTGIYSDLVTNAVIIDLKDQNSGTTVVQLDATDVPQGLCTSETAAAATADAVCTSNFLVSSLRVIRDGAGDPAGILWNCVKFSNPDDPFWVFAECP